jgi:hypothetical protein
MASLVDDWLLPREQSGDEAPGGTVISHCRMENRNSRRRDRTLDMFWQAKIGCPSPDASIWGQAGVLAGLLFRLSNLPKDEGHGRRFINDSLVFLQARQLGASVLTGNVRDFDFLNRVVPTGRIILYRTSARPRSS